MNKLHAPLSGHPLWREISGNIVNVTELANQTDASTQQVFANANDLMELSATLQKLVTRFKA